jgi:hypothetical protein
MSSYYICCQIENWFAGNLNIKKAVPGIFWSRLNNKLETASMSLSLKKTNGLTF